MHSRFPFARARRRLAALVAGSGVFVAGCGYTLGAGAGLSSLHEGRPVLVGRVENQSSDPEAGPLLVRSLSRALPSRGGRAGGQPFVVDATIESVRTIPVGFVGGQNVALWRVEVRLQVRLVDHDGDATVARSSIVEAEEYRSGTDLEATEVSRRLALERVVTRAAENGLDRLAP